MVESAQVVRDWGLVLNEVVADAVLVAAFGNRFLPCMDLIGVVLACAQLVPKIFFAGFVYALAVVSLC